MIAKRNFKGFEKGQAIPADKFTEDQVKVMVKRGFIEADKKVKAKKADKK